MKVFRSCLTALAILLLASAAEAQQTKMKVNVPFDFYAGDQAYPAGEYTLNSMSSNDAIVRIGGNPEVPLAVLPSNACGLSRRSEQTKLVFHHIGNNYFLYQVWMAGNLEGRQFPISRVQIRLAQNGQKSETVIVAARLAK